MRSSRGCTQGLNTIAIVRLKGRIAIIILPIIWKKEGTYCKKLISSCDTIVQTHAPLGVASWWKDPWDERVDFSNVYFCSKFFNNKVIVDIFVTTTS